MRTFFCYPKVDNELLLNAIHFHFHGSKLLSNIKRIIVRIVRSMLCVRCNRDCIDSDKIQPKITRNSTATSFVQIPHRNDKEIKFSQSLENFSRNLKGVYVCTCSVHKINENNKWIVDAHHRACKT